MESQAGVTNTEVERIEALEMDLIPQAIEVATTPI
jgi:hypothetical protein